ncbi:hypothetical protein M9H77_11621 [Catharanthus roseus]|uniref:Uncharacterized protein n=1 Tax=Catharanthus roseus TaxID=4058 RepID=A0ACC0BF34_CATRO|nr:hypothetical protein M9H77_11621 [Catharanthus roseus]
MYYSHSHSSASLAQSRTPHSLRLSPLTYLLQLIYRHYCRCRRCLFQLLLLLLPLTSLAVSLLSFFFTCLGTSPVATAISVSVLLFYFCLCFAALLSSVQRMSDTISTKNSKTSAAADDDMEITNCNELVELNVKENLED